MPLSKFIVHRSSFIVGYAGFTLIEIMVALGIMAVIGAVAMPNLTRFSKTQEIDNTASQLVNILKRAQSSAASRIKCPNGLQSTSWQVNLNTLSASDTYDLVSNCQTTPATSQTIQSSPFAATTTNQTKFSASTNVCPASENTMIYFTGLQMTYKCTNSSTSMSNKITISLTGNGFTKDVTVDPGGTIKVE